MKQIFLVKSFFMLVICLIPVISFSQEIDVKSQWERHNIDLQVYGLRPAIALGDLNGDGRPDVVDSINTRNNPKPSDGAYWYESPVDPKNGTWIRRRLSNSAMPIRWSLAHAVGDVDNDGDLDVVALSFDDSNVYLSINPLAQGGDVYSEWQTIKILNSPGTKRDGERVEVVDVDGDGFKDVVFPRGSSGEVHILFNPLGVLTNSWNDKVIGIHGGSDAHDVYYADIDQDGDMDIISAAGDGTWSGRVDWFEHPNGNPRNGSWVRHQVSTSSANYGGLQIDDINNDGYPDILATQAHGGPGEAQWYKNPYSGSGSSWTKYVIGTQNFPHSALSIDVDGDGTNEYWVPDASHSGSYIGGLLYFKLINADTNIWAKYRLADAPEVARGARKIDMDGDGDLDVVSSADHSIGGNVWTTSIVWWENKTSQSQTDSTPPSVPLNLSSTAVIESQIDLTWQASSDPESGISKYKVYRDGTSIGQSTTTSFSDTGLNEGITYSYEISAVNGAGLESGKSAPVSKATFADTTPPTIDLVSASGNPTQVTIVFSELVEQVSAEEISNYHVNNGITVLDSSLGLDLKTVTLTSSSHNEGVTYTLTTNNVRDRASIPNVIALNTKVDYTFVAQLIISNLIVNSGLNYEIVQDGLYNGELVYIDRGYVYSGVPTSVEGNTYIKTANSDKGSSSASSLTFDVNQDVTVYVAHDDRISTKPSWMASFTETGDDLVSGDGTFSLFKKDFPAGTIILGGNEGAGNSMYSVVILGQGTSVPPDTIPPSPPEGVSLQVIPK